MLYHTEYEKNEILQRKKYFLMKAHPATCCRLPAPSVAFPVATIALSASEHGSLLSPLSLLSLSSVLLDGHSSLDLFRLLYGFTVVRGILEGIPVRPSEHIPKDKVLPVVVVEPCVMDGVVRRAVDERQLEGNAIVNVDSPQPNPGERHEVRHVVHGQQEHEDVIRATLQPSVERVKRVR